MLAAKSVCICADTTNALIFKYMDYTYELKDGEAILRQIPENTEHLVVPAWVGDKSLNIPVTEIDFFDYDLENRKDYEPKNLKTVTLPPTIRKMSVSWKKNRSLEAVYISDMSAFCRIEEDYHMESPGHHGSYYEFDTILLSAGKLYLNGELVVNAVIPEDVTTIPPGKFYGTTSIESFTFMGPIQKIECYGINSRNLKYIDIRDIKAWCNLDFYTHYRIIYEDDLFVDGSWIYSPLFMMFPDLELRTNGVPLTDLVIPENTTWINSSGFRGYKKLRSVTMPSNPVDIDIDAFEDCVNIKEVRYQSAESLAKGASGRVGQYADKLFIGGKLTDRIDIPEGVTKLSDYALSYLPISSVTFPKSLKSVGNNAFKGSFSLHRIDIPEGVEVGNETFRESGITEIDACKYYGGRIPKGAFRDCKNLEKVEFSRNIYEVGHYAFCGCSSLRSLSFPPKTPKDPNSSDYLAIGSTALLDCPSIEFIDTGNWMRNFWFDLFPSPNLKTIVLGENIDYFLGDNDDFEKLTDIWTMAPMPPEVDSNWSTIDTFSDWNYENTVLHVREGSELAYKYAPVWKNFKHIEVFTELPEFSDLSSVDRIEADSDTLPFKVEEGRIIPADNDSILSIYSISGQLLHQGYGVSTQLPAGIYIIVLDGKSCKIAIH